MCDYVELADGWTLETPNELINNDILVYADDFIHGDVTADDYETCLCCVDIPKVLNRTGVEWVKDPFGFVLFAEVPTVQQEDLPLEDTTDV